MSQNAGTSMAEKMIDSESAVFSFRDLVAKIFLRPKLFFFALLLPPLVAVFFASLVPPDWSASTKILIRYSSADSGVLQDLVSSSRQGLSGTTSAALIKSTPVLEDAIARVGITGDDIYQKSTDVIKGKIAGLFSSDSDDESTSESKADLVSSFKASLESSSKKSKKDAIAILEKTSQVPDQFKLDELITIQVKSFNREKVAEMADGLAASFIDEYYRLYAKEAGQQHQYVDGLVKREQEALKQLEQATPTDFAQGALALNSGRELPIADVPILASMATQLSLLETELNKMQQVYAPGAAKVRRLKKQVNDLRFQLKKQERIEISKQLIEQLKARRYQALNTEKIYKDRLIPIKVVEYAVEPKPSGAKKLVRIIVSGIVASILGLMLALGLMIFLNAIDPRVHFAKDVSLQVDEPILGSIPKVRKLSLADQRLLSQHETIEQSMWQLITRVGRRSDDSEAKVIALTGTVKGEGTSTTAMALALNLAKNQANKVCLIDANFKDADISHAFNLKDGGLIEAILGQSSNVRYIEIAENHGLFVMPAGKVSNMTSIGYYADAAENVLNSIKKDFNYIIVDTGLALAANEALTFGGLVDETIVVTAAGVTRKGMLRNAVNKLKSNGIHVSGVVINKTKNVLPEFLYRLI